MDESLPCPVCGGRAWAHYEPTTIRIYCPCCDIVGPKKDTIEEARAAWNALLRALEWTDEPPKVPGWYWQKGGMFSDKRIILISNADVALYPEVSFKGKHGVFQWAGPIPEPREPKE